MHTPPMIPPDSMTPPHSHHPTPTKWQKISSALGYCFKVFINCPYLLLKLIMKVITLASQRLFPKPPPTCPDKISSQLSTHAVPPNLTHLFQNQFNPNAPVSAEIKTDETEIFDEEAIAIAQSPPLTRAIPIIEGITTKVVDVPDDGNCLFYSIAVGLAKKCAHLPAIQKKLQWEAKPDQLTADLSKSAKLLEIPARNLREQASAYLKAHLNHETIQLALMEGILSHGDVVQQKINEEEAVIPFIKEDINNLTEQLKTSSLDSLKKQLQEKKAHLAILEDSLSFQKRNIPDLADLEGYIDMTKQDHIYCGLPQVLALSKDYNVPIRVIYMFGKPTEKSEIYNEEAYEKGITPIITIAHVNGNHFKFIED